MENFICWTMGLIMGMVLSAMNRPRKNIFEGSDLSYKSNRGDGRCNYDSSDSVPKKRPPIVKTVQKPMRRW